MDYQIGFGALPNHHCILKSLSYLYPKPPYDDSMVDRFRDPGAGAFTYVRRLVPHAWLMYSICLENRGLSSHQTSRPLFLCYRAVAGSSQ